MNTLKEKIGFFKNKAKALLNSKKKIAIFIIVVLIAGFSMWKIFENRSQTPQYQTAVAERGTLITSVSSSGVVSTDGSSDITTGATGIVKYVYVKNGDTVTAGQKIADIELDQNSQQKQQAAWASYLSAQNSLNSAKAKMNSLQSALFKANQAFVTDRGTINPITDDPIYIEERADWLQAESDYNNQAGVISQTQASLNSAWLLYQQISSSIISPTAGTINNLTLSPGLSISSDSQTQSTSTNTSTTTSGSTQTIGSVVLDEGKIQAAVNLSEIDIPKIKLGQKATLTLDAFPDKTFTGEVSSIDTNGTISSGVTNYPASITFDSNFNGIYPNMSVTANIITRIIDNALLIPSSAVQTSEGQSIIRVMKNGVVSEVQVEVGASSDTQTEIKSGLSEGDNVVTSIITNQTTTNGSSPFSGARGLGGLGGGGNRAGGGGRGN